MIYQLIVIDKKGQFAGHIEKIFSGFIRGYQIFRAADPDEAFAIARRQMIDVVVINGNDFRESLTQESLRRFKEKVIPPPKLLLLLESNLVNTLPALEGMAHYVMDTADFRSHKFSRIVHNLIDEKYREEKKKKDEDLEEKKRRAEEGWEEVDNIIEELERKELEHDSEG